MHKITENIKTIQIYHCHIDLINQLQLNLSVYQINYNIQFLKVISQRPAFCLLFEFLVFTLVLARLYGSCVLGRSAALRFLFAICCVMLFLRQGVVCYKFELQVAGAVPACGVAEISIQIIRVPGYTDAGMIVRLCPGVGVVIVMRTRNHDNDCLAFASIINILIKY